MVRFIYFFLFLFGIIAQSLQAQLSISRIFTSDMMLQCDVEVPIWGTSNPDGLVSVVFQNETFKTQADSKGNWQILLPPTAAGAIENIRISTNDDSVLLNNIIFGDIWLCGGQSNMEWFFEATSDSEKELAYANNSNIRLLEIPHQMSNVPLNDFAEKIKWNVCNDSTVLQFSGVGYYFGKFLHEKVSKPIGLISNNYGGTVVEAWMSDEGFIGLNGYEKDAKALQFINLEELRKKGTGDHSTWISKFYSSDNGIKDSIYSWADDDHDKSNWQVMELPRLWETSSDTTLAHHDGVIWFAKNIELNSGSEGMLSLGPIDDSDMVWINGLLIGETYNRYNKDRIYHIPPGILKPGKNTIVVRVEDYIGGGGLAGPGEKLFLEVGGDKKSLSGDWQYKIGYTCTEKMPVNAFNPNNYITSLYNGMISPMVKFPIKGVIWYQGESNTYRAVEYADLFQRFILDWRNRFNINDLPFIFVQLANYYAESILPEESTWAELREAQQKALALPKTSMITAIDIGDANNIHPANKREVGSRLALAAARDVYGMDVHYKGPTFKNAKLELNSIVVSFDNIGAGLRVNDKFGYVFGFTIAGEDKKFHWAKAEIISQNTVKVWCNEVIKPVAVRYAWQNNPAPANLKNSFGMPALPFRTDSWTLSTQDLTRYAD
ncbi:MAG: sialate O-acetylesterase [Saprospiraceae bacterium]